MTPSLVQQSHRLAVVALGAAALWLAPVTAHAAAGPSAEAADASAALTLKKKKKKGKKKKGKKKKKNDVSQLDIERTGIKSIDDFFSSAGSIDKKLDKAQNKRRKGRTSVATAMGLKKGASLPAATAELKAKAKGNLTLAMTDGVPQLKPKNALPSDAVAGVEAVNTALKSYVQAVGALAGTPKEAAALVKKAKQMPDKLKAEFSDFNPLKIPEQLKALKVIKNNIKLTASLPKRSTTTIKGLNKDIKTMVEAFGGSWPPKL